MVRIESEIPWPQLEQRVRETTLLHPRGDKPVYPYEDASIRLEELSYSSMAATSLYVVRKKLALQTEISRDIAPHGYHQLDLEGGLLLAKETGEKVGLVPPIVEKTDADGMYLLDGAHRTSIGRWQGRNGFMAILISGIRPDCPSYALPNSWDELKIFEEVPEDAAQKKRYRGDNYAALYRDFGPLNGSHMGQK